MKVKLTSSEMTTNKESERVFSAFLSLLLFHVVTLFDHMMDEMTQQIKLKVIDSDFTVILSNTKLDLTSPIISHSKGLNLRLREDKKK